MQTSRRAFLTCVPAALAVAGTGGFSTVDDVPFFLQAEQLKPFVSEELLMSTTPILWVCERLNYPNMGQIVADAWAKVLAEQPHDLAYGYTAEFFDALQRTPRTLGVITGIQG